MTHLDLRAWLGVLLAGTLLGFVGCHSSSPPNSGSDAKSATKGPDNSHNVESANSSKLFADWPKSLAAVLVISGEMDGYLEPCGCTQGQLGGLIRRADFLERLRAQNPVALIDLGGLIKDPAAARGGFEQAKIKFGIALKAYSTLKYDAIALSAEDLKVGIGEAFAQFLNGLGEKTKIVAANVVPGAGFESRFEASRIIPAGRLKIGVTAVTDPEALAKLVDPDKSELLTGIKRPDEVLGSVLAEMEPKSDFQVLMVQGSPEEAKRLALAYPGFDVVVSTSQFADPLEREQVLHNGSTLLVSVGRRGKSVGAVGFFPGESPAMRFHLQSLNTRFSGPGTEIKKVIQDEYRNMLKGAGVVENFPRHDYVNGTAGATFVGSETCKQCHPNTYMKWATTKHAQAFNSLLSDPKPNTIFDAECVSCHTTGFGYTSGYRSEAATPYLKGNQCENCHGPASKHVANPDNFETRKPLMLTAEQANKNLLCIHCHDEDNSPDFGEFAVRWGQITHKGLDEYKNPRVHRGITPKVATSRTEGSDK
jgi:hypothetical protein